MNPTISSLSVSAAAGPEPQWAVIADGIRLIALRALGDPAQAEDIAQEAITRAIASLAAGRETPISDPGAFVYGIARHLIADMHRREARRVALEGVPEPIEPKPDALERAIAADERERVRHAMSGLAEPDRQILRLFFVQGLTAEEVGVRFGETAITIRKRKSRALARLRQAFLGGGHDFAAETIT